MENQQPEELSAAKQREAGMGGSYAIDKRGDVELAHRSEVKPVSHKAPLKRELPDGTFEEVEQLEDGTLVPLAAKQAPAEPSSDHDAA